ncbi:protein mono-ADP-ribosyltransferase PARP14-like [Gigantopelta aegis]|uniref:protein mono-ADP-ribosyltransferase PARP14-like n=1 Tax=Gigantopelta aegis TaxID=1735272 RepID=UPI001B88AAFC|nr:protein mono-ADP-ribosyltransferase PARP14-like [Gigantopelta aegis]
MASAADSDRRKVVVKNISVTCSEFTLQNFLEIVFDNEVESFEYFENNKETALVSFTEDVQDFDICCQKDKVKKPIEGSRVELIQVVPSDSILVENLLPDITEDALTFYFENKKSGGKSDAVVSLKIYKTLKMAVVNFVDVQVAASVLSVKSHAPSKDHVVTVKPYIEALHQDTLEKLSQKAEEEKSAQNVQHISPTNQAKKNIQQNASANSVKSPPVVPSKPVVSASSWKSRSPEPELMSLSESNTSSCNSSGEFVDALMTQGTWQPKNEDCNIRDASMFQESHTFETSEVQKSSVPYETPLASLSKQNIYDKQIQVDKARKEREEIANEMERKAEERIIADSRRETEKRAKPSEKVVHYKRHEVKLIQKVMSDMGFPDGTVEFNANKGIITIKGQDDEICDAYVVIMETKNQIEDVSIPLLTTIVKILKTDAGRAYMKTAVMSKDVEYTVTDTEFKCAALSINKVQDVVQGLKRQIQQDYINFGQEHNHYLSSPAWMSKKELLEKEFKLMRITCDGKKIRIDGLNGDVNMAKREVEQELKKNSHRSETFKVTKAKARCFEKTCQKEIADLKVIISKYNGNFKESSHGDTYTINFSGEFEAVSKVSRSLDTMVKSIWHEAVVLVKDVAKDKDLELLIRGLVQTNLKTFQAAFEAQHSCFLDFTIPTVPSSAVSSMSAAREPSSIAHSQSMPAFTCQSLPEEIDLFDRPQRRVFDERESFSKRFGERPQRSSSLASSITVPPTNCKITVSNGDITKQKADILVNVVPSNLDLASTKVSQAYQKAGGPAFVKSYDGAKVLSQAGVITATVVGNLSCSLVFNIILDQWDSNNPNDSKQKLKKAIDDCFSLAHANKATSIAFPPVGCGILFKFPSKFVAASFISAAKAAANKGQLQEISFFIFDKSVHHQFLTAMNPSQHEDTSSYSRGYGMYFEEDEEERGTSVLNIGSTTIQVKQGDLAKYKATVLVNVITSEFDMRRTAVSQAFVHCGGGGLLKAFEKETSANPQKRIFVTFGYDLNCEYVYHIVLNKYDHSNSAASRQELIDIIDECFTLAKKYKTKSIAFPAVGCGALFKYSSSFVASSLVATAKQAAAASNSLKEVAFVIYDQHIYNDFVKELSSMTSSAYESEAVRSFPRASQRNRKPSEEVKTAKITVVAKTQDVCVSAKKVLIKELQSRFLHTEFVQNEGITKLPYTALKELETLAEKKGIFIKFPDSGKTQVHKKSGLKLKGEKETVITVKSRVQEILLTEMSKTKKQTFRRKKRGDPDFIQDMATTSDHRTPTYWTYFKSEKSFGDILKGVFSSTKKAWSLQSVPAGSDIYKSISDLIVKTWKTHFVGHGQDAKGILAGSSVQLVKVERLENLELFRGYCQHRAKLFVKAAKKPITPIKSLPKSKGEVETTAMAAKHLRQDIYVKEINEHYVFHGTRADNINAICEKGLDSRVGNTNGMFGPGVYAAESSTKADQYADDKSQRTPKGTNLCMILARMALGEPFVTSNPNSPKFRQPPCKHTGCNTDGCKKHTETYDSVLGDGKWNFREFVVYERDLIYPEYIITYQRV